MASQTLSGINYSCLCNGRVALSITFVGVSSVFEMCVLPVYSNYIIVFILLILKFGWNIR